MVSGVARTLSRTRGNHLEPVDPAAVSCKILGKGTCQDERHAGEGEIAVDKEAEFDAGESRRPDV
jgi:hypothetical protein